MPRAQNAWEFGCELARRGVESSHDLQPAPPPTRLLAAQLAAALAACALAVAAFATELSAVAAAVAVAPRAVAVAARAVTLVTRRLRLGRRSPDDVEFLWLLGEQPRRLAGACLLYTSPSPRDS